MTQIHDARFFLETSLKDNGFLGSMSTFCRQNSTIFGFALVLSAICHFFVALSFPVQMEMASSKAETPQRFLMRLQEKKAETTDERKSHRASTVPQATHHIPVTQKKLHHRTRSPKSTSAPQKTAKKSKTFGRDDSMQEKEPTPFNAAPSAGALMNRSFATLGSLAFPVRKQGRVQKVYIGEPIRNPFLSAYIASFEHKIKRIGSLNFPSDLKKEDISLTIQVEINQAGELNNFKILRSSGIAEIDEATHNIIYIASPFGPFPEELAKDLDALQLVRVIRFRGGSG